MAGVPQAIVVLPSYWVVKVLVPEPTLKFSDAEPRLAEVVLTVTSLSVLLASAEAMQLPPRVGEKSPALLMVAEALQRRVRTEYRFCPVLMLTVWATVSPETRPVVGVEAIT